MLHPASLGLVQQHVLTGTGNDGEEAVTGHLGHLVGIAAGAVEKVSALHRFPFGGSDGKAVILLDFNDLEIPLQFHAVVHGVANGGNGQVIGADDARIGHIQSLADLFGKVGLHFPGFLSGNQFDAVDAVFKAAVIQLLHSRLFLRRAKGNHQ